MSRQPVEFVLKDFEGKEVKYSIIPHPSSEALGLVWNIMHVGAKPLARLLEGNLGRLWTAFSSNQPTDVAELLGELDLHLSSAMDDVFSIMQAAGPEVITRDLLAHTYRNGKSLKQTKNFDDAYTANYGEMLEACSKAMSVNRFLGLFRTSIENLLGIQLEEVAGEETPDTDKLLEQLEQRASTGSSGASG